MTPEQAYKLCHLENKRKPELEPIILTHPYWSYLYAKYIIKDRWSEAEPIISTDAEFAYLYARNVIKGRWPETEPMILKSFWFSYLYARYVIKGRWPEAESTILTDPKYSCWYAKYVIQDRWPEAELILRQNEYYWQEYCDHFNIQKGYHQNTITKGVLGEFSKIKEEFLEAEDAFEQKNSIMLLLELSDLIGSIEKFCVLNHKVSLDDLIKMKNVTSKVFEEGYRTTKGVNLGS